MAESKQPREALERFVKASAAFDAAKNEYAFAISDLRRWAGADVIDYPVLIGDVIVDTARKDGDPPFVVRPVYPVPADLPDRDEPFIVYDRQRERWVAALNQSDGIEEYTTYTRNARIFAGSNWRALFNDADRFGLESPHPEVNT